MAMQYEGKTYRNLQEQVAYLTRKWQELADEIEEVRAQIPSKMIVEELPEEGDPLTTYYVGPKGTAPNQYYEVWIWVQEEEDGPFVWRELEDTDQVDLSGYLPIQDGVTTLPQVYGKTEAGEQVMVNMDIDATALTIPFRDENGRTKVAAPSADGDAANKKYCDDGFVAKQKGSTSERQVYSKAADGTQTMLDAAQNVVGGALPIRSSAGHLLVPDNPNNDSFATNKKYVDTNFLAKQTGTTTYNQLYAKKDDGTQLMFNVSAGVLGSAISMRKSDGNLTVPEIPTANGDAASKAYVNAAVGQLIYHHTMTINYTTVGTDYVKIAAHIDSNQSTPFTTVSWGNMHIIEADYAIYYYGNTDYMCSVRKLPYGLHQDEFAEPRDGFMITFWDGSEWKNKEVNSNVYGTPTVTDVVTTW